VQRVSETVVLRIRGVVRRFEDVQHERCLACGERIFDLEVSRQFDAMFLRRRRPRAA
jgi:YgiT-type zinc finger domain-containing protein